MSSRPQPGARPDGERRDAGDESADVSLTKDSGSDADSDAAADAPFDPYRFGKPDRPPPREYWPPGYQPDPEPAAQPPGGAPYPAYPPNQGHGTPPNPYAQPPAYGGYPPPYGGSPYPPPPYGAPYPPAPYGAYGATARPSTTKAMLSMIFGIASIVLCWLSILDLAAIVPAIVLGIIGLNEARRHNGAGRGMAIAGLVCAAAGAILAITLTVLLTRAVDQCGGTSQQNDPGFNKCVQENIF